MGRMMNVITVVPVQLAVDLSEKKKITNYNTLPNINPKILEAVREFMTENVGYANLPLACLNANARAIRQGSDEIFHYIPSNSNNGVVFIMQMPSDMIVSVSYDELLENSQEADDCGGDDDSLEFVKESFKDLLVVGPGDYPDDEDVIEFVPYLDYTRCKGYAKFDENFDSKNFELPGVERYTLAKLTAFIE